jgi:hypothetical protein
MRLVTFVTYRAISKTNIQTTDSIIKKGDQTILVWSPFLDQLIYKTY